MPPKRSGSARATTKTKGASRPKATPKAEAKPKANTQPKAKAANSKQPTKVDIEADIQALKQQLYDDFGVTVASRKGKKLPLKKDLVAEQQHLKQRLEYLQNGGEEAHEGASEDLAGEDDQPAPKNKKEQRTKAVIEAENRNLKQQIKDWFDVDVEDPLPRKGKRALLKDDVEAFNRQLKKQLEDLQKGGPKHQKEVDKPTAKKTAGRGSPSAEGSFANGRAEPAEKGHVKPIPGHLSHNVEKCNQPGQTAGLKRKHIDAEQPPQSLAETEMAGGLHGIRARHPTSYSSKRMKRDPSLKNPIFWSEISGHTDGQFLREAKTDYNCDRARKHAEEWGEMQAENKGKFAVPLNTIMDFKKKDADVLLRPSIFESDPWAWDYDRTPVRILGRDDAYEADITLPDSLPATPDSRAVPDLTAEVRSEESSGGASTPPWPSGPADPPLPTLSPDSHKSLPAAMSAGKSMSQLMAEEFPHLVQTSSVVDTEPADNMSRPTPGRDTLLTITPAPLPSILPSTAKKRKYDDTREPRSKPRLKPNKSKSKVPPPFPSPLITQEAHELDVMRFFKHLFKENIISPQSKYLDDAEWLCPEWDAYRLLTTRAKQDSIHGPFSDQIKDLCVRHKDDLAECDVRALERALLFRRYGESVVVRADGVVLPWVSSDNTAEFSLFKRRKLGSPVVADGSFWLDDGSTVMTGEELVDLLKENMNIKGMTVKSPTSGRYRLRYQLGLSGEKKPKTKAPTFNEAVGIKDGEEKPPRIGPLEFAPWTKRLLERSKSGKGQKERSKEEKGKAPESRTPSSASSLDSLFDGGDSPIWKTPSKSSKPAAGLSLPMDDSAPEMKVFNESLTSGPVPGLTLPAQPDEFVEPQYHPLPNEFEGPAHSTSLGDEPVDCPSPKRQVYTVFEEPEPEEEETQDGQPRRRRSQRSRPRDASASQMKDFNLSLVDGPLPGLGHPTDPKNHAAPEPDFYPSNAGAMESLVKSFGKGPIPGLSKSIPSLPTVEDAADEEPSASIAAGNATDGDGVSRLSPQASPPDSGRSVDHETTGWKRKGLSSPPLTPSMRKTALKAIRTIGAPRKTSTWPYPVYDPNRGVGRANRRRPTR